MNDNNREYENELDREYDYESDRFSESVNVESLSYKETHRLLVRFFSEVLLPEMEGCCDINKQILKIAKYVTSQAEAYFIEERISSAEIDQCRMFTWMLYKAFDSGSKESRLMRVLVFLTYSEARGIKEYEEYGVDMYFYDAFFPCLRDLGEGYCKKFTDYAIEKLS